MDFLRGGYNGLKEEEEEEEENAVIRPEGDGEGELQGDYDGDREDELWSNETGEESRVPDASDKEPLLGIKVEPAGASGGSSTNATQEDVNLE